MATNYNIWRGIRSPLLYPAELWGHAVYRAFACFVVGLDELTLSPDPSQTRRTWSTPPLLGMHTTPKNSTQSQLDHTQTFRCGPTHRNDSEKPLMAERGVSVRGVMAGRRHERMANHISKGA